MRSFCVNLKILRLNVIQRLRFKAKRRTYFRCIDLNSAFIWFYVYIMTSLLNFNKKVLSASFFAAFPSWPSRNPCIRTPFSLLAVGACPPIRHLRLLLARIRCRRSPAGWRRLTLVHRSSDETGAEALVGKHRSGVLRGKRKCGVFRMSEIYALTSICASLRAFRCIAAQVRIAPPLFVLSPPSFIPSQSFLHLPLFHTPFFPSKENTRGQSIGARQHFA